MDINSEDKCQVLQSLDRRGSLNQDMHMMSSASGLSHTTPKRSRTNLTEEQKDELEKTFISAKYPDYPVLDQLSRNIGLPYKKVLVWFKNRRAKDKRLRKTSYTPYDFAPRPSSTSFPHGLPVWASNPFSPYGYPCMKTEAKPAAMYPTWYEYSPYHSYAAPAPNSGSFYYLPAEHVSTQTSASIEQTHEELEESSSSDGASSSTETKPSVSVDSCQPCTRSVSYVASPESPGDYGQGPTMSSQAYYPANGYLVESPDCSYPSTAGQYITDFLKANNNQTPMMQSRML